jgi:hypothetical protein
VLEGARNGRPLAVDLEYTSLRDFGMDARFPRDEQGPCSLGRASAFACPSSGGRGSIAASVLVGVACFTWAGMGRADEVQELELSKNRFDAGQYEEAHRRFTILLDPARPPCARGPGGGCRIEDPDLIERARVFDAASLIALKRMAEAEAQIEKILRQNPTYAPNPALFPQEVVDQFTEVRGRLRDELEKETQKRAAAAMEKRLAEQKFRDAQEKWIADLQRLASRKVAVHSRWIAGLPLGIGQYQNGDIRLGAIIATTELLLAATTVVSAAIVSNYAEAASSMMCSGACLVDLEQNASAATLVNRIAFGTLVGVTVAGIVQAELAFVPERVVDRSRPIPPRPQLAPTVSLGPGGFGLGLVGQF